MRASDSVSVSPPAKINLHLRVGPKAADGFHPISSWMVTVGLFDKLDLELSHADADMDSASRVRLTCDDPAIPTDASNLIVKAAAAMFHAAEGEESAARRQAKPWSLSAALHKNIPVGAGLGGGSSDAAATMTALNRMLRLNWPPQRLAQIAATLGSDLPFFLFGPSSICAGRGEIVEPTPPPKPRHAVLLLPKIHMPTPAVYRKFDEMNLGRSDDLRNVPNWKQWSALNANDLMPLLINDLEPPAFAINPAVAEMHQRAGKTLNRIVRMSGSGSSLFSLFDSRSEAESAALHVEKTLDVNAVAVELCPYPYEKDNSFTE
jgi:4-diphosphocytidyl-2-C-methyl-D-erythritol kinase